MAVAPGKSQQRLDFDILGRLLYVVWPRRISTSGLCRAGHAALEARDLTDTFKLWVRGRKLGDPDLAMRREHVCFPLWAQREEELKSPLRIQTWL